MERRRRTESGGLVERVCVYSVYTRKRERTMSILNEIDPSAMLVRETPCFCFLPKHCI